MNIAVKTTVAADVAAILDRLGVDKSTYTGGELKSFHRSLASRQAA